MNGYCDECSKSDRLNERFRQETNLINRLKITNTDAESLEIVRQLKTLWNNK